MEAEFMEFLKRGLAGGLTMAAAFIGFAGTLYLFYLGLKALRPKKVRQEQRRILSHPFYPVCWRGRAAYLILCLEETLIFYRQDLGDWEWILQKLWTISTCSEENWLELWLDSAAELLPSAVLAAEEPGGDAKEAAKARRLYTQAGFAMIVVNVILENLYEMAGAWSAHTEAHDPEGLCRIDQAEETMQSFGVPLPPREIVQRLATEQKGASLGNAFDRLRLPR